MNREIQFRAWLKNDKVMTGKVLQITDNPNIQYIKFDKIENWEGNQLNNPTFADIRDVVLMQYTGLKDNNCKKIFEGDLVQKIHKGKAYQVCEVKFKDGSFGVDDFDANGCKFFWSLRGMQHCWKVVGNIYENPELLGGANE